VPGEEAGQDAVAVLPAADVEGEEEGGVPDVVQPEGDERALDDAVDEHGQRRIRLHDLVGAVVDEVADGRPNEGQHDAEGDRGEARDDGDEPLAGEEAEILRQLYAEEPVEQVAGDDADEDAAEDAGVERVLAEDVSGLDAPRLGDDTDGPVHHQVADRGRQRGYAVVPGHAQGGADGEDQRQSGEDRRSRALQDLQEDVDRFGDDPRGDRVTHGPFDVAGRGRPERPEDADPHAFGTLLVPAGEGAADPEQDTRHRQDRDGQHQRLADLLQEPERPAPETAPWRGRRSRRCRRHGALSFVR
jgi:hypothetical protein